MGRGFEYTFFQRRHIDDQPAHEKIFSIIMIREMQIKTMRYHLEWLLPKRQEITNIGEDVDKREPSYTVGGTINWCSHYGKQYGDSSEN